MKYWQSVLDYFDDRLNPITVKELRQAVQGRFLTSTLVLFLLFQLIALSYAIANGKLENFSNASSLRAGHELFIILFGILTFITWLLIPLYTGVRVSSERSQEKTDLFFITTLTPNSIILGKLFAALILTLFLFSASAPFLTFTYLLRGIDLLSIFLTLLFALFGITFMNQIAILLGLLSFNKLLRFFNLIFALSLAPLSYTMLIGFTYDLTRFGLSRYFYTSKAFLLSLFVILLLFAGFLHTLTVALIMPNTANRALPVRLYFTVMWLALAAMTTFAAYQWRSYKPFFAWGVVSVILFSFFLLITNSLDDGYSRRIRKKIPQKFILRLLAFPFFSGATSGTLWTLSLAFFSLSFPLIWKWFLSPIGRYHRIFRYYPLFWGILAFVFFYVFIARRLWHRFFSHRLTARFVAFLSFIVFFIFAVFPLFFIIIFGLEGDFAEAFFLFSPFLLDKQPFTHVNRAIGYVLGGASFFFFLIQVKKVFASFRPLPSEEKAEGGGE